MNHLGAHLSALLDGELTPVEAAEADAHLLTCLQCRSELQVTRQTRDLIRQLPSLERPSSGWVTPLAPRRSLRPVAALAAVAAVALVGVVAWPPTRSAAPPLNRVVQAQTVSALTADSVATLAPSAVNAPFQVPESLPGGYQRVAMSRQGGDLSAVYAHDGFSLVVYEQPAHLDRHALPPGGQLVPVNGWMGVSYAWPGGRAVTWQRSGTTYTVVGDGPDDDVIAAAGALKGPRSMSTVQRMRRTCRGVVEALSGLL